MVEITNKMDITRVVENMPDGKSVKIIAEARKDVLDKFIELSKGLSMLCLNLQAKYEFFDIIYVSRKRHKRLYEWQEDVRQTG